MSGGSTLCSPINYAMPFLALVSVLPPSVFTLSAKPSTTNFTLPLLTIDISRSIRIVNLDVPLFGQSFWLLLNCCFRLFICQLRIEFLVMILEVFVSTINFKFSIIFADMIVQLSFDDFMLQNVCGDLILIVHIVLVESMQNLNVWIVCNSEFSTVFFWCNLVMLGAVTL